MELLLSRPGAVPDGMQHEGAAAGAPKAPTASEKPPQAETANKRQDNNVLHAAAALLSMPLAASQTNSAKLKPSRSKTHPHPYSPALVDLVSPNHYGMLQGGNATTTTSDDLPPGTVFYEGTCSLALPEDEDFLSPLHSFIRRYCVETFTATQQDASESQFGRSHGSRVIQGQVGIRCLHCRNTAHKRERAVCFPSSLKNIYHSIETWQRRHSLVCQDIPAWCKASMVELCKTSKSGAGGRRQYWEESARRIGLANTGHGIRFIRPPGDLGPLMASPDSNGSLASVGPPPILDLAASSPGIPVVMEEDKELVKDYLYVLLDQMEQCAFSEEDRAGGRSKVKNCPNGYIGMQCRHCKGKAGFGRYFPGTLAALTSANSDRNIFNHIMKCRRCPQHVKDELAILQQQHQTLKNRRGSRKLFFEKIWERLHGASYPVEMLHLQAPHTMQLAQEQRLGPGMMLQFPNHE